MPKSWQHYRATIAAERRHRGAGADTADLERDLRAALGEDRIRRLIDRTPDLSTAGRTRLAVYLLDPPGGEAA
jgi:hypothetical protein